MTNILTKSPTAILIHIPKTGFTSLRSLFDIDGRPRAFGFIPRDWPDVPKIAAIRHPEARFLSALRMFKYGNPDYHVNYQKPRIPDLTVSMALDLLEDESVAYDRTLRTPPDALKHHLLPQTHPYNCLSLADHILRVETLSDDYEKLRVDLDLPGPLPHLRKSARGDGDLVIPDSERNRFEAIFAEDFDRLGYRAEGGGLNLAPHPDKTIWGSWPGLFDSKNYPVGKAADALPDKTADLTLFQAERVPGKRGDTWAGRDKNLREHFLQLQPEFAGTSRLAHLLACSIVTLRRTGGKEGKDIFFRILDEHTPQMVEELNSRWLVSVCDTLADHGRSPEQRAIGLAGSMLMNTVKLAETERRRFHPKRPWPPQSRMPYPGTLFDGIISFWIEKGDMVDNMRQRACDVALLDPVSGQFLMEMIRRVEKHDTVFSRLKYLAGKERPRAIGNWPLRLLEMLGRRYL